ncbi:MAG: hypothetical protein U0792_14040 [Gemmataceae bacterium]
MMEVGPANFFKVMTKPGEIASTVSQVFLGVRIHLCRVPSPPVRLLEANRLLRNGPRSSPRSREQPRPGSRYSPTPSATRCPKRTCWATAASPRGVDDETGQPLLRRNLSNRIWGWMLGRGLVEPVDDV